MGKGGSSATQPCMQGEGVWLRRTCSLRPCARMSAQGLNHQVWYSHSSDAR